MVVHGDNVRIESLLFYSLATFCNRIGPLTTPAEEQRVHHDIMVHSFTTMSTYLCLFAASYHGPCHGKLVQFL